MTGFSDGLLSAVHAGSTDEIFLVLLTLDHPGLDAPIRVCNNGQAVISAGETFVPYPFDFVLPGQTDAGLTDAKLTISNVGREITAALERIEGSLQVSFAVVLASAPDDVQLPVDGLELREVTITAQAISGTLTMDGFMAEPYPKDDFTPATCPGLFKTL